MCKIILKYGDITAKEVNDHRENCEEGAGLIWFQHEAFQASKSMRHQSAYHGYGANYIARARQTSPWTLFHSRIASAGEVNRDNIQPFQTTDFAFCHNGTVDRENLFFTSLAMGFQFNGEESDSLLISRILQKCQLPTALAFLKMLDQNFVYVHRLSKTVHVLGNWDLEMTKSEKHLLKAKNKTFGDKVEIATDFSGKILKMNVEKSYNYSQYNSVTPAKAWLNDDFDEWTLPRYGREVKAETISSLEKIEKEKQEVKN